MSIDFRQHPFYQSNKEGLFNGLLLSVPLVVTLYLLHYTPETNAKPEFFSLPLLMEFVVAVWVGWYTPWPRVIGLIICGALFGYASEWTAGGAGLWKYINAPLAVGVSIHALTAVALFGLVYVLDRLISSHAFSRRTGWFNCLFVVALFFALFALAGDYQRGILSYKPVFIYYCFVFVVSVTLAYCIRLGKLLSIIIAAMFVALAGEYAGGTQAKIWCWLNACEKSHFPPLYLVFALWPMEFISKYGLSVPIADLITWWFKVRKQRKREADIEEEQDRLDIDWYNDRDKKNETLMDYWIRRGRPALAKMLRKTPENGEVFLVFLGMSVGFFIIFGEKLYEGFPEAFTTMNWRAAALVSVIMLLALMVASKPYWHRALAFGLFAVFFGYAMQVSLGLAFNPLKKLDIYLGHFFWGPLWALLFFVIYGAAYLINRYFASMSLFKKELEDQEEPNFHISISAVLLMLIFLAVFLIRPDFLTARVSGDEGEVARNLSLLLLLGGILGAFCFWWFFLRVSFIRWFSQLFTAAVASAALLFLIKAFDWISVYDSWLQFLISVGAISLAYIYCYTVSAHISGECVAKAIRINYGHHPIMENKKTLSVIFHADPKNGQGRRRVKKNNDELHTYPPIKSGVNVTFANDPESNDPDLSIRQTVEMALEGLVGYWPGSTVDEGPVHRFREAVRGKKVFIKPNVVVPFGSPYTTDPDLVAEVTRACLEAGAIKVCIGEMAISNITSRMSLVFTGLKTFWESISEEKKVEVILMDERPFREVQLSGKVVLMEEFLMPKVMLERDTFYINMPKMKTHLQSLVTLGIKNSHGLVPHKDRGTHHERISQKVVDITKVWMPDLTIIDGYDALEGMGPWPGDLVPLRALVTSNDVVLADLVATQLMGMEDLEENPARFPDREHVDFDKKRVKSTWLGYEQGLGHLNPQDIIRTIGNNRTPVEPDEWAETIEKRRRDFKWPEFSDEGLIRNIGARFNKEPDLSRIPCAAREFLPLSESKPIRNWGPIMLISDEWRDPDLGASVMYSGVFGLMKTIMESHFGRALDAFKGFVIVYGPLRKPLVCEGAILFGDGAIETEYMVLAPRIYHLAGHGKPPNYYSDTFERLSHDMGGELMAFCTEAVTLSRGEYW